MKVNNIHHAVQRVEAEIKKQLNPEFLSFFYCNNGRHCIIETDNEKYYVLFKREFFKSFGVIFDNEKGIGESINEIALSNAINMGVKDILIVYPTGYIYRVNPLEWQNYAVLNNTIRQPHGEKTFSIPIKMLERFDNDNSNTSCNIQEPRADKELI